MMTLRWGVAPLLLGCVGALGLGGAVWPADAPKNATADAPPASPAQAPGAGAKANAESRPVAADPFSYQGREDTGFVAMPNARIPEGLRMLGVIVVKGKSLAAIRVPGAEEATFVGEGSVVQVFPASAPGASQGAGEPLYIHINRITPDEIEISPRTRPEDKRILR